MHLEWSGDKVVQIGPLRVSHQHMNEKDRSFVFQVGRLRPGHNGIHGIWEPLGGRADWDMEFGHVLMLSGRVLDPRPARRRLFEQRGKLSDDGRVRFGDEGVADEIAGGAEPPADGYL